MGSGTLTLLLKLARSGFTGGSWRVCLRQLVLDHVEREGISEKTGWSDWKTVQQWTDADFESERATLVSRLAGMRMRAINQALRKGQLQSAAQMMDALGRVVGEAAPEQLAISAPDLKISIEPKAED